MRKSLLTITLLFISLALTMAQKPAAVLDKMSQKLASGAVTANYVISSQQSPKTEMIVFRGKATMLGNKLLIDMQQGKIGFDGTTQWNYSTDDQEVTLTTPTTEEAQQLNPFALIDTYRKNCNIIFSVTEKLQDFHVIEFYPKDKFADLKCLTVYINKVSNVPARLVLTTNKGSYMEIKFSGVKTGQKVDAKIFNFDKTKFPNAEINDLR